MWPFKKKSKRQLPFADDLSPAELQWLEEHRKNLAGSPGSAGKTPMEAADEQIRTWHRSPESKRANANDVALMAGVALGDALAKDCAVSWKIVTDEFGTEMALWRDGERAVVLSPMQSVAKRFTSSPQGCVVELHQQLRAMVQQMSSGSGS